MFSELKSVTPLQPSDWRRLTFSDLAVLLFFGSARACLFVYLGHPWFLAHMAFSLFTDVSPGDVTGA
jgi:hypothetical protein